MQLLLDKNITFRCTSQPSRSTIAYVAAPGRENASSFRDDRDRNSSRRNGDDNGDRPSYRSGPQRSFRRVNRDDAGDNFSSERRGQRSQRPYSSRRDDDSQDDEAKYRSKDYEADYDDEDDNEDGRRENKRGASRRFSTFSLENDSERDVNSRRNDGYRNDYRDREDRRSSRSDYRRRDDDGNGEGFDRRPARRSYRDAEDGDRPGPRFSRERNFQERDSPRNDRREGYSDRSYRNDGFGTDNRQQQTDRDSTDTSSAGKDYHSADGGRRLYRDRTARAVQDYGSDRPPRRQQYTDDAGEDGESRSSTVTDGDERPAKPPRLPTIKPRLDLPVVSQDKGDKGTFYADADKWESLGLTKDVADALRSLGFKKPSHIQAATLRSWNRTETQHLALADQAGSGKTLAYLLPLIQAIRSQDAATGKPCTLSRSPRAIIITPTTELVQQVYRVAKALSNAGAKMRVVAMTGGQQDERERYKTVRTQRDLLAEGVDLVIATPGRLVEHLKAGNMDLSACRGLVLDEVDVLLGDTAAFDAQMTPLRDAAPEDMRFVLVTATLPQHTAEALRNSFKDITLVSGPGLHRTAAGLVEELVDCSGGDEITLEAGTARKIQALHKVLKTHQAPRTLVFCNKIESCRDVENALRRAYDPSEVQVLVYHEAVRQDLRQAAMNAFLAPVGQEGEALEYWAKTMGRRGMMRPEEQQQQDEESQEEGLGAVGQPQEQEDDSNVRRVKRSSDAGGAGKTAPRLIMVATDRLSRGIDCMFCQHVVLFDFPRDPSEYVRRVGRTARGAAGTGVVSALVLGRQVSLAQEIMGRNEKGQPVHRLPRM